MDKNQPKLCLTDLLDQDLSSFELFQSLSPKIKQEVKRKDPTNFDEMQNIIKSFENKIEGEKIYEKAAKFRRTS